MADTENTATAGATVTATATDMAITDKAQI